MFKCTYGWTYEVLKKKINIDLYQGANLKIDKIASSAEYRMDEQFQNGQFLVFRIEKNLEIF